MFAQKLQWLRKAQIKFPALESDQAGSLGERLALLQLHGLLKKLHGRAEIFQALRVPKRGAQGKYEIDLLLVTEVGVLVIEVKHWGGQISQQRDSWLQERAQERKLLNNPVALNEEKRLSLQHWLAQKGIKLPNKALHAVVLFTNPQVALSPELKKLPGVVDAAGFEKLVLACCGQRKRWFWQKRPRYAFDFSALTELLAQLPTWDRLELHGGQVLYGDLEYVAIPHVKASALQRKYLRLARVKLSRRLFPGLFLRPSLRVMEWSGEQRVYPLHPSARLVFRPAGQSSKEEISWLHVESLHLGWKDHSYY